MMCFERAPGVEDAYGLTDTNGVRTASCLAGRLCLSKALCFTFGGANRILRELQIEPRLGTDQDGFGRLVKEWAYSETRAQ